MYTVSSSQLRNGSFLLLRSVTIFTLLCFFAIAQLPAQPTPDRFYAIDQVQIPAGIELEVGGLAFNDAGQLGVVTRRGELWLIDDPASAEPTYTRFAHGLHEPLGLNYRDGSFYCAQRGELTRITDTDGDGRADRYEAIYSWELAGNYHEYSYGPVFTPEGDMLVTLNLGWIGHGASLSEWRGWLVRISPEGELTPIATGLRSPSGFGYNAAGDLFYTENQGDWVGSGYLTHLERGDFAGNPEGLIWTDRENSPLDLRPEDIDDTRGLTLFQYAQEVAALKPPAVWFPHGVMGISTSGFVNLQDEFGPAFNGQMLVGDQGWSQVTRVALEQVNGVYQGVCFPFVAGFASGVLRLQWNPQRTAIYVGMTDRGWNSRGPEPFGLQRLTWSGETPFEIQTVRAHPEGFELRFTQPVDPATLADPASYAISDFTYQYHHFYGSPPIDQQERSVLRVSVQEDDRSVVLHLDRLRRGYVYEVKAPGIRNTAGQSLLHDFGYYALNEIPGGAEGYVATAAAPTTTTDEGAADNRRAKNPTEMPATWTAGPDEEVVVKTVPGLKYNTALIRLTAGSKVKLTLENTDDMLHNLVITAPDQATAVGEAALELGLAGEARSYIPDLDAVLYYIKLLQPESAESIYFVAPAEPGTYEFVCTFPGHHLVMRGILQVVAGAS